MTKIVNCTKGKNQDPKEPLSYRPVALICNPSKVYTSILNKKLVKYLEANHILVEEQNGFRKGRSCFDHIFVLDAIIDMKFSKKTMFIWMFCGFFICI